VDRRTETQSIESEADPDVVVGLLAQPNRIPEWAPAFADTVMAGYISRGLIMAFTDAEEARAGCELFRLEPTPERLGRMLARDTIGDGTDQAPTGRACGR
jgi:hypothetical protein